MSDACLQELPAVLIGNPVFFPLNVQVASCSYAVGAFRAFGFVRLCILDSSGSPCETTGDVSNSGRHHVSEGMEHEKANKNIIPQSLAVF